VVAIKYALMRLKNELRINMSFQLNCRQIWGDPVTSTLMPWCSSHLLRLRSSLQLYGFSERLEKQEVLKRVGPPRVGGWGKTCLRGV
jgi:hypothetical protein